MIILLDIIFFELDRKMRDSKTNSKKDDNVSSYNVRQGRNS